MQRCDGFIRKIPWWGRLMILPFVWFGIPAAMGGVELIFRTSMEGALPFAVILTPFLLWWRIGFISAGFWELLLSKPPDFLLISPLIAGVILHLTAFVVSVYFLVKPRFWSLGSLIFLLAASSIGILFGFDVMSSV